MNTLLLKDCSPSLTSRLNDIDNTNRIAVDYLWKAGFSAVIVNPFVGFEGGLDSVFASARSRGKGVITLAFMSHIAANEGYGLKLEDGSTIFELFLQRAKSWSADGVILGSTRPEKIKFAKSKLEGSSCKIFSPGSGAQGGDPTAALDAGSDYLIYGRVDSGQRESTSSGQGDLSFFTSLGGRKALASLRMFLAFSNVSLLSDCSRVSQS